MVDLETAIEELNTGIIEFTYPKHSGCTTEGEVVICLRRLKEFEEIGLEPQQILNIIKTMPTLFDETTYLYKSELDFLDATKEAKKEYFHNLAKESVQTNILQNGATHSTNHDTID